jgi:hypothetical protein
MTTEHSTLPWEAGNHSAIAGRIFDALGDDVASCRFAAHENPELAQANAAFIVKACNAHDELIKALREIDWNDAYTGSCSFAGDIARAALAKVGK